ncbi:hypothetical protein IGI37_002057 [Enterococcus sp. AZ194]
MEILVIFIILFLISLGSIIYGYTKKNKSLLLGSFVIIMALFTLILYIICALPQTL